jgi:hypothetical protein
MLTSSINGENQNYTSIISKRQVKKQKILQKNANNYGVLFGDKISRRNQECSAFIVAERHIDMPAAGFVWVLSRNLVHGRSNPGSHALQKFFVGRILLEQLEEGVQCLAGPVVGQNTPERGQAAGIVITVEFGFFSSAAGRDVDRREDSGLGKGAVENDFTVARSLELLEDKLIHSRAGIDQARRYNGGGASVFNFASKPEESAGDFQNAGFQSAAHSLAAWCASPATPVVESSAHSRETVDQQDNLSAAFQLRLYMGEHQLGEFGVLVGTVVARTGYHFGSLHGPAKVGDFLGPLVHQQHNNTAFRGTLPNRLDGLFQEDGLSRLGRRNDQLARTLADWRNEVDDTHALLAGSAQVKPFVRIDGHQIGKPGAFAKGFRFHAPHRLDGYQFSFAFLSLDLTGNGSSFSEPEAASYIRLHYHFSRPRSIRTVGCSYRELLFVDTSQYSSYCIGHKNVPFNFSRDKCGTRKRLYHTTLFSISKWLPMDFFNFNYRRDIHAGDQVFDITFAFCNMSRKNHNCMQLPFVQINAVIIAVFTQLLIRIRQFRIMRAMIDRYTGFARQSPPVLIYCS